ncbi:MAG: LysR substrate-binding domain-containing protein [Oricola sp.]
MRWNINDVPVFVAVVEQKGVTAAAQALSMPKSTVSKALARLEEALGLRLVDRNSRSLRVTAEGETFYRQALLIMEQVREADAAMAGLSAVPSGRVVAALPPAFCQEMVAPNLPAFRRDYPEIELELIVTTHGIDLRRDQVDVAVVVGPQEDSELISRSLYSGPLLWVTSPSYLRDNPLGRTPEQLLRHVQLCEKRYGTSRMPVQVDGQAGFVDLTHGITHVNDPLTVRRAVLGGAGVSPLPELYCRQQLREGSLVAVAGHIAFDLSASALSVVYPGRRLISPRIRAFLAFLDQVVAGR